MPKSAAPRTQRRKYVPPATAEPKAACLHLVRPDGKVLMIREDEGAWTDPGGRIAKGESLDAAAPRLLLKETGLELKQLLDIGARRIGSVYQKWSRAQVLVYEVPDIPGGHQWRDVDSLVRAGKARVFRDGGALTFRLDRNLALSAMLMARCHPGRGSEEPLFVALQMQRGVLVDMVQRRAVLDRPAGEPRILGGHRLTREKHLAACVVHRNDEAVLLVVV